MKRAVMVALTWLAAGATGLPAQDPELLAPSDDGAGPWHSMVRLAEVMRSGRPAPADVVRVAQAELMLGRPTRARALLDGSLSDSTVGAVAVRVAADATYRSNAFPEAAALFDRAAETATGRDRAVLLARAGDAWERAGDRARAAERYHAVGVELPGMAGWLALREARVAADSGASLKLLERAAEAAPELALQARAEVIASAGDTARAVAILAGAGFDGRAATLAIASRDSANARQLAYRALRDPDTIVVNIGMSLALGPFPPEVSSEYLALARALRRVEPPRAASLAGRAVAVGDSSPSTLLFWGDILTDLRNNVVALQAYTLAAGKRGAAAQTAGFNRARTLLRLGRPEAAGQALREFIAANPEHASTPMALYLYADLADDTGLRSRADSLYREVARRWPKHEYAGESRFRLASSSLRRGDTAQARTWYRNEIEAGGAQQLAARFLLGRLQLASRDSAGARETWIRLAREDSAGYYGAVVRGRAELPEPVFDPVDARARGRTAELDSAFVQLDFLEAAAFGTEAATLRRRLFVRPGPSPEELLARSESFAARGYSSQGISLAWRASTQLGLGNVRVLRGIYPWPLRAAVEAEAREFGLDPYLLAAVIRQESNFEIGARSRAGARGLMQLMPGTARQAARRMGVEWDDVLLHVADANIHLGASHLAGLLRYYHGDVISAVAAYNAGSIPVERWRRAALARDPDIFVERITYPETRGYVRSVLRNRALYRALYPPLEGR